MDLELILTAEQADQIIDHARQGKPEEVCGILRGRNGRILEVVAGKNVAEERIENYTLDSGTLLKQFKFEEAGDTMTAIYHSHPVSEAYPSATDAWNAHYPDVHYLICSLEDDENPVLRTFALIAHYLDDLTLLKSESDHFTEVRSRLFGLFQSAEDELTPGVSQISDSIEPPFYLVFNRNEAGEIEDGRIVEVREGTIKIA